MCEEEKIMLVEEYNFWVPKVINVLGTDYTIKFITVKDEYESNEAKILMDREFLAYCSHYNNTIILSNLRDEKYNPAYKYQPPEVIIESYKETLRHELIHAFYKCSGLNANAHGTGENSFANDEEMIDFLAIQTPKMFEVFRKANLL